jgi:phosphoribosylanthranilate isomerase
MTRAKICGVTTREDLEVVVESGADAIGLTVDVPVETPREIDAERAANIVSATPPFVTTVLVTMPDPLESVTGLAERVGPDIVQVHGDSAPEEIASISADLDAGVVVAVSPDDAPRYDTVADALLVDSLDEAGAGGTGSTHDWERTRDLVSDLSSPVVLAGGLTPENVAEAVETVDPFAVDVASGVEKRPGRKEPVLVDAFVRHARGHL